MTDCEQQQAGYLEDDADAVAHVRTCPTCGHLVDELDLIREMLGDARSWEEPAEGLADQVVAAVTAASSPGIVSLDAARSRRRGAAARVPIWSLAAAVLLAVGVTATVTRTPAPHEDAHFALAGSELAPHARAAAVLAEKPNGIEIRLRITGLPRAPQGSFYEAWVKGDAGLVPIGTFHSGDGEVVLWSGVPRNRYGTITVTLEDEDGNPASSGRRVLVGEIPAG